MNTDNRSDKDLEYQLPEEQFGEELGPEFQEEKPKAKQKKSFLDKIPKKKMLIGGFLLVMAILVYQFLSRQEEKALEPPEATLQPEKAQSVEKISTTEKIAAPNLEKSKAFEAVMVAPDNTKELKTDIESVKQTVKGVQDNLSSLVGSIESLSGQMQALRALQVQAAPATLSPVMATKAAGTKTVRPVYYLKAVTPGREKIKTSTGEMVSIKVDRAWLTDVQGQSYSIKVGDQLKGYGCVSSINADEGWVSFTSGAVIRYSSKDA